MQRLGSWPFLAVILAVVTALLSGCGDGDGQARAHAADAVSTGAEELRALAVLHRWDLRRARAWAAGDVAALRELYVPDSVAGERDVALLAKYVERGVVVPDLRMQLLRAGVVVDRPRRVVVRVTERLASRTAYVGRTSVRLPRDTAQTRVIELRRAASGWQVVSVGRSVRR